MESAKLRALSAHVPACLECLRAHVPTCLACLRAHVRKCFAFLHPRVPTCLLWLRADVSYTLTCSHINVPCVPTCSCTITSNYKIGFMKKTVYEKCTTIRNFSRNISFENSEVNSCISLSRRKPLPSGMTNSVQ